jgi:hypothetical protein
MRPTLPAVWRTCCLSLTLALAGCGGSDVADNPARSEPPEADLITYFLIFPSDEATARALPDLRKHNFTKNEEYTAGFAEEGEGWLVVERADTDPEQAEDVLNEIAEKYGGTYDGYERAVP